MFFAYFVVGALGLYLAWQLLRWFAEADPKQLVRGGQWALAGIGGAVALWLIVSGKAGDALVLMTTMAPFFVRWKGLWSRMRNSGGPTPGGEPTHANHWLCLFLGN